MILFNRHLESETKTQPLRSKAKLIKQVKFLLL